VNDETDGLQLENTDAVISPHLDAAPPTKQDS
jgi:hypothetical protein